MIETCSIKGEIIMEPSGANGVSGIAEDKYIEFEIPPSEELNEIESSINDALERGGDVLPMLYLLNYCRNLTESDELGEYDEACALLSGLCRNLPGERGGRLRPVGDYLDFCID
jgi:hypothetical protein